jgi:hypothetical protein
MIHKKKNLGQVFTLSKNTHPTVGFTRIGRNLAQALIPIKPMAWSGLAWPGRGLYPTHKAAVFSSVEECKVGNNSISMLCCALLSLVSRNG